MSKNNEIFKIMMDDDFLKITETDEVIKNLEASKFSRQEEFFALTTILEKPFFINEIQVKQITPLILVFLWIVESPFVVSKKKIEKSDIDFFFYVLINGVEDNLNAIFDKSKDFCLKNNFDYAEIKCDLEVMIKNAFKPLDIIPISTSTSNSSDVIYNVDWAFSLAMIVQQEANYKFDISFIIKELPLTTCYYYYVNYLKKIDKEGKIRSRSNLEIEGEIYRRTIFLAEQYFLKNYEEKGKIK